MRTFSLGAGADVVKFTSSSAADANTITNFTVANDKLSFDDNVFAGSKSATSLTTATNQATLAANTIYVGTYANISSLKTTGNGGGGGGGSTTTNSHVAIVTEGNNKLGEIYYIADDVTQSAATVSLVKIGSIDNVASLAVSNFDFFTA